MHMKSKSLALTITVSLLICFVTGTLFVEFGKADSVAPSIYSVTEIMATSLQTIQDYW